MIPLLTSSQVTYTIDGKKYVCYTPEENRSIAFLILENKFNKEIVKSYYAQIKSYSQLVVQYKADSAIRKNYIINLENGIKFSETINNDLAKANVELATKVKRKNKWIGGLAGSSVGLLTILILLIAL